MTFSPGDTIELIVPVDVRALRSITLPIGAIGEVIRVPTRGPLMIVRFPKQHGIETAIALDAWVDVRAALKKNSLNFQFTDGIAWRRET